MNEPSDPEKSRPRDDRAAIDEAAREWFLLITTGAPTEAERARFEDWRQADPRHQAAYAELQALWDELGELQDAFLPPEQARPDIAPRRSDETPSRPAAKTGFGPRRRPFLWGGLAAACALFLLLTAPNMALRLTADYYTGIGEQAQIKLPDGAIAWLNTGSALSVQYSKDRRQLSLLRGEARFEVAEDKARPFAVMARAGRSTALGTIFSVRDDGGGAVVTVGEGTVGVSSPAGAENAPPKAGAAVLKPGEQVRYQAGAPPGPVRRVNAAAVMAWRQGYISIINMPLTAALLEIDRYRPGRIVLLSNTGKLEPVTARLSIASIDAGLDALAATNGLSVTRLTKLLVIVH